MSKKLENKDLVSDNILQPLSAALDKVLGQLSDMDEELKKVLKTSQQLAKETPLDSYENIKKVEEGLKGVEEASEGLSKNEKDRIRILKQLSDLTETQSQENENLRQRANQLRKEQRELAKENIGLTTEYQRQSKALNEARNAYKNLSLQTESNRKGLGKLTFRFTEAGKELRKLEKEVNKADKSLKALDNRVGQNFRTIGDYTAAIKKGTASLTKLAAASVVLKALEGLATAFQSNSTSAAAFDKAIGAITATVSVTLNVLISAVPAVLGLLSSLFAQFQKGVLEVKLFAAELQNTFGTGDKKRIQELKDDIADLNKEIANNKGFDDLSKAFDGFFDDVSKAVSASNALVDATQKSRLEVIRLNNTLSLEADSISTLSDEVKAITLDNESLLEAQTRLEEQSGNNLISLQQRAKATKELSLVNAAVAEQNVKIAQEERRLAAERVRLSEIGIKDGAKNIAAREQLAEADKALAEAQATATKERLAAQRELSDIETDLIERNLDFIIDDFDRRKAVNEKIIADETQTFAKRRALAVENRRLAEKSFRDSVEEINKGIEAGKEKLDFDKLVALEDSKLIAQAIENSGLNDKLAARALEIIKERIAFNQELFESERDLNKARQEGRETEQEILFLAERLNIIRKNRGEAVKELDALEERILQNDLSRINQQLEAIKKLRQEEAKELIAKIQELEDSTSEEDKIISDSLNRRLQALTGLSQEELDLLKEKAETEIEIEERKNKKLIEQRVKLQETLSALTNAFFDARFERQNEQLDKQLEAEKQRTQDLRALAQNNVEGAADALAFQQKREAEIEKERERIRKRQLREKAFITLLDTASAKAAAGDENALVNTIFDAQVLKAFAANLASFYDGTDLTGKGNIDSKGGFLAVLHPNETVLSEAERAKMGNPTSREDIITGYNLGKAILNNGIPSAAPTQIINDNQKLVNKLDKVQKAIENKPVFTGMSYDQLTNLVTDRIEQANKVTNNHRRAVRKH